MHIRLLLLLALSAGYGTALAADSRIELSDGSLLRGQVSAVDSDGYWIDTTTLGRIHVPQAEIRAIYPCPPCTPEGQGGGSGAAGYRDQIEDIQLRMAMSPGIMESILALQDDPEILALLADGALMQRIMTGDIAGLNGDPRLEALMRHPGIRALVERLK